MFINKGVVKGDGRVNSESSKSKSKNKEPIIK